MGVMCYDSIAQFVKSRINGAEVKTDSVDFLLSVVSNEPLLVKGILLCIIQNNLFDPLILGGNNIEQLDSRRFRQR